MLFLYAVWCKMTGHAKASMRGLLIMRKTTIVLVLVFASYLLSWAISFDTYAANSCLSCHGSADKLKSMIKDEDYNKPSAEGYG